MNNVTEVLHIFDKLPGDFYTPQKGSAFRPCVKRTRARNDPAIAALLQALHDEHDLAVAMHEHDHGAPLACNSGSPTSLPNPQSLFVSPPAVPHDRVATGSHCELTKGAAPVSTPSPRSSSAALLGETTALAQMPISNNKKTMLPRKTLSTR